MAIPEMIRADKVVFYMDNVYLPRHKGVYHSAPHDRADKADSTLFVSTKGHHIYIKDDVLVSKRKKYNPVNR